MTPPDAPRQPAPEPAVRLPPHAHAAAHGPEPTRMPHADACTHPLGIHAHEPWGELYPIVYFLWGLEQGPPPKLKREQKWQAGWARNTLNPPAPDSPKFGPYWTGRADAMRISALDALRDGNDSKAAVERDRAWRIDREIKKWEAAQAPAQLKTLRAASERNGATPPGKDDPAGTGAAP